MTMTRFEHFIMRDVTDICALEWLCACLQGGDWQDEDGDGDADHDYASNLFFDDYADLAEDESDPDAALDPINDVNLQVRALTLMTILHFVFYSTSANYNYLSSFQAYLTEYLQKLSQQPCYVMFHQHNSEADISTLKAIGIASWYKPLKTIFAQWSFRIFSWILIQLNQTHSILCLDRLCIYCVQLHTRYKKCVQLMSWVWYSIAVILRCLF